jgi:hypothetical protein
MAGGRETTTYVRNIFKYYISYKLLLDSQEAKKKAREAVKYSGGATQQPHDFGVLAHARAPLGPKAGPPREGSTNCGRLAPSAASATARKGLQALRDDLIDR